MRRNSELASVIEDAPMALMGCIPRLPSEGTAPVQEKLPSGAATAKQKGVCVVG